MADDEWEACPFEKLSLVRASVCVDVRAWTWVGCGRVEFGRRLAGRAHEAPSMMSIFTHLFV